MNGMTDVPKRLTAHEAIDIFLDVFSQEELPDPAEGPLDIYQIWMTASYIAVATVRVNMDRIDYLRDRLHQSIAADAPILDSWVFDQMVRMRMEPPPDEPPTWLADSADELHSEVDEYLERGGRGWVDGLFVGAEWVLESLARLSSSDEGYRHRQWVREQLDNLRGGSDG